MVAFTKVFSSLLDSSVWFEPDHIRLAWVSILLMADRDGVVEASILGLAHRARITIEQAQQAIDVFTSPDPHSRTKDSDGRRVREIAGGWLVINYELYRDKSTPEESKEKAAARKKRWRERMSRDVHGVSRDVPSCPAMSTPVTHSEAEAEASTTRAPRSLSDLPGFATFWTAFDHKVAKPAAEKAWRRIKPDAELAALIATKAAAYAAATPDKAFRKHPATWLRNECWNDELPAKPGAAQPRLVATSTQHIPNMPLGHSSCSCDGCIAFRAKRTAQ